MSPSQTTGNFSPAHTQCCTENAGLQLQLTVSAFPLSSHSDSGEGDYFRGFTTVRLRYDLLLCLPSCSELTRFASGQRGRLLPGFRRFGHPRRRQISLQCQLGNLHWRDLHPLDHQLASLHRLANHYPDDVIAGILNRQGRKTATGERFTAIHVGGLRRYRNIPRFQPLAEPDDGELVNIRKASQILGVYPSTIHRWLNDGFIAGEQVTPGAPWQIRMTDKLRARFVGQAPPDYLPMLEATMKLGVSRQTVLQRVKRGELEAVLVTRGRRKGLRIKVVDNHPNLFESTS